MSLVFLSILGCALADIYMHYPRGSNNRLNENSANRRNANRAFDSQVSFLLIKQCNFSLKMIIV